MRLPSSAANFITKPMGPNASNTRIGPQSRPESLHVSNKRHSGQCGFSPPRVSLGFPEALGDESFDYRRCVLPSANGDRGRMSYERSDDEAVIGGHSIQAKLLVDFHYRFAQNLERRLIFMGHVASYSSPAPAWPTKASASLE
jgi:hypothetical protein